MKKIFLILFAAFLVVSCKKNDVDLVFDKTPEERISESISKLRTSLTSAENGWIGVIETNNRGAYGLYLDFNEDETLNMLMDGNADLFEKYPTSDEIKKSTYRIKHVMATSLLFDTYNYLTLLQDPVPGVAGGTAGEGYGSDVEFELVKYSDKQDTIYLKGKKHDKTLLLYKATAEEKAAYAGNKYANAIKTTDAFFDPIGANYFKLNNNEVQIVINNSTKSIDFVTLDKKADTVSYVRDSYAYSVSGLDFIKNVNFQGKSFTRVRLEGGKYYIYDTGGEKYLVNYSDEQIISLKYAIGVSINQLVIPGPYSFPNFVPLPSWSSSFKTDWNTYVNLCKNGGYNLTVGNSFYDFDAVNKRINVATSIYQGTSSFSATYQYSYVFTNDGDIKFTKVQASNGNAGIIVPYMDSTFHKRMLTDTFVMGYDIDANFGKLVKFTSKENPSYYFTMVIN
ncbi:DUF4302 domain-containing protein [Sphingobacterium sp.]|uniref:DUF4302 domain-containing protein n=1 Tax=Sphingobacterium sp. TaxID=341027 RepID=UPI0028A171FC|nr:DUF4302 domain-containing protein [Sphingobacterium sp.]